jgi:hypothetical protein
MSFPNGPGNGAADAAWAANGARQAQEDQMRYQAWRTSQVDGVTGPGAAPAVPGYVDPLAGLPRLDAVVSALVKAGSPEARRAYRSSAVRTWRRRWKTVQVDAGLRWNVGTYEIGRDWRHSWGSDYDRRDCVIWVDTNARSGWSSDGEEEQLNLYSDTSSHFTAEVIRYLMEIAERHGVVLGN